MLFGIIRVVIGIVRRVDTASDIACHQHTLLAIYHQDVIISTLHLVEVLLSLLPTERIDEEIIHLLITVEEHNLLACRTGTKFLIIWMDLIRMILLWFDMSTLHEEVKPFGGVECQRTGRQFEHSLFEPLIEDSLTLRIVHIDLRDNLSKCRTEGGGKKIGV